MMRVLLIEHDARLQEIVKDGLGTRGFSVTVAPDGLAGIEFLRTRAVGLVLLDLALPDLDGLTLLTAIRAARPRLPVIALTARDDVRSTLDAFDRGADDCVTKPFLLTELVARIRARLRWRAEDGTVVEAGPLRLNLATHRAALDGNAVLLSSRESSLLAAFLRNAGQVLSRDELLRRVWEIEFDPGSNVVDVYVAALRRKLGPNVIETVRGHGYRLRVGALVDRNAETPPTLSTLGSRAINPDPNFRHEREIRGKNA
jgi:DNA-binding response OmpR family regulator